MIVSLADLPRIRKRLSDKTIVFACGTFDLIHPGHVDFLEWCSQQGDALVVAINSDHLVRKRKGPSRPIQNKADRMRMVAALKAVTYVVSKHYALNSRIASIMTAELLRPDVVVLGHDWGAEEIEEWRCHLPNTHIIIGPPREAGRSTSHIISRIQERHGKTAA